jgi:hypothetical protein
MNFKSGAWFEVGNHLYITLLICIYILNAWTLAPSTPDCTKSIDSREYCDVVCHFREANAKAVVVGARAMIDST